VIEAGVGACARAFGCATAAWCGARPVAQVLDDAAAGDLIVSGDDLAHMRREAEALDGPQPV